NLTTRRYARRSIARKASALRRYFAWAARTGRIDDDPARRLGAPQGDSRLPRVLSEHDAAALVTGATPRHGPAPDRVAERPELVARDDAVLELLYGSGLRVGELC